MIDLHSHVLPGLDDGVRTLDEAVALARAAVASGVRVLAATPHVRDDYPTSADAMLAGVETVRAALAAAGIPLQLLPGGELDLAFVHRLDADALARYGLGGNPRVLLVESPSLGFGGDVHAVVEGAIARGFTVVLAHPERNAAVQERPDRLGPLVARGVLVQLTAASLDGRLGKRPRAAAQALLDQGLAHLLASDAHAPEVREAGLAAAVDAVGDAALARWLVEDVPRAILSGTLLPPRPEVERRRRRFPWSR